MDIDEARARAIAVWSSGHYPAIAVKLAPVAAELVRAAGVSRGSEVLDVAAGDGNVALEAARIGARVTGSDLTPAMVEFGRARTDAESLEVEWIEADAQDLPFENERFDATLSNFGAIFAPDPEATAREMLRVTRPGGVVALSAWIGEDEDGFSDLLARHLPPPPGPGPFEWGDPEVAAARLAPAEMRTESRNVPFEFGDQAEAEAYYLRDSIIPAMARGALDPEGYEAFAAEFRAWIADHARPDGSVVIDNPWLLVLATV